MYENTIEGTAQRAKIKGYYIGGKTATGEKVNDKGLYDKTKLVSSFLSVFPINEPKHHNYYLGFWTGSDSENYFSSITIFNSNYSIIFSDNFSLIGEPEYHAEANKGTYNKKRRKTEMRVEVPYNEYLYFDCYISNINSSGMYNIYNYIDVGISIRFGIDY